MLRSRRGDGRGDIDKMRTSARELAELSDEYAVEAKTDNLMRRLRLVLSAREKAAEFTDNALLSITLMFGLTSSVQSHTSSDLDEKFVQLLGGWSMEVVAKPTLERLLADIEKRIEKDK